MKIAMGVVAVLVLLVLLKMIAEGAASRTRPELGLVDGALRACPNKPNCVSSRTDDERHRIAPLATEGDEATAVATAAAAIERAGGVVVTRDGSYLHAEFTSRLFRFVDDVELVHDPDAGLLHVRSASRVGHSDLGANRKRVERLRRLLADGD